MRDATSNSRARQSPASLGARLRYRFDTVFSKGTLPIIGMLLIATVILVISVGFVIALTRLSVNDSGHRGVVEAVWLSLLRTLDPGTMGGDTGWPFRIAALTVTVGGIFIVSTLIGLLANGIDRSLDQLKKGRSTIVETGHTVILGWSSQVFTMLQELVIANENQRDVCVSILAPHDKVEMDDEIKSRVGDTKTTRFVTRTGDPSDLGDLDIVRPFVASSIIVLAPDEEGGDAGVIRTVLALMNKDENFGGVPVIAELRDSRNASALDDVTRGRVTTVVSIEIIAKITAQVCRSRGVSMVYQDLLDFAGDEIYFEPAPDAIIGATFGDALLSYEKASVIGLRTAEHGIQLAPDSASIVPAGADVIAIAEDETSVRHTGIAATTAAEPGDSTPQGEDTPEHTLVLGWNEFAHHVLSELDRYVPNGSTLHVAAPDTALTDRSLAQLQLERMTVTSQSLDIAELGALRGVLASEPDHIILLCPRDGLSAADADAQTLLTLLRLRHELAEGARRPNVIAELRDPRDVELAGVTEVDDLIVSERLTSLLMSQLSKNVALAAVFDDLFSHAGAELYLVPASRFVPAGTEVSYATVVAAASRQRCVAIGYRSATPDGEATVVLNPAKSAWVAFAGTDGIFVLTETA